MEISNFNIDLAQNLVVMLYGSWDNWTDGLIAEYKNFKYSVDIPLKNGIYYYKWKVQINDNIEWFNDKNNSITEDSYANNIIYVTHVSEDNLRSCKTTNACILLVCHCVGCINKYKALFDEPYHYCKKCEMLHIYAPGTCNKEESIEFDENDITVEKFKQIRMLNKSTVKCFGNECNKYLYLCSRCKIKPMYVCLWCNISNITGNYVNYYECSCSDCQSATGNTVCTKCGLKCEPDAECLDCAITLRDRCKICKDEYSLYYCNECI